MKKILSIIALGSMAMAASAQETYESATLATEDLNGTARYVGMGGAMEALGADISTINTNPAGVGLFRKSWAGLTFGFSSIPSAEGYENQGKTATSWDQAGFVYTMKYGYDGRINFAVNYKKSANFNSVLPVSDITDGSSMNTTSYIGAMNDYDATLLDNGLDATIMKDADDNLYYMDATDYVYRREQKGYVGAYDFNFSWTSNDRVYWGLTVGLKDVHYKSISEYEEFLQANVGGQRTDVGSLYVQDERQISGIGWDIKGGVIIRPIEYSPFRIGLSIATPTWYTLDLTSYLSVDNLTNDGTDHVYGLNNHANVNYSNKYKIYTPWKFGVSAGHTFSNIVALGASYEFADYGSLDNRVITDEYYDPWDGTSSYRSSSDEAMNRHTKRTLKGVHTVKVGGECKLSPELSVRLGYNYVSPMYKDDATKDPSVYSKFDTNGITDMSSYSFVNWGSTNRLTLGLGYTTGKFSLDLAYQMSTQNGTFKAFPDQTYMSLENVCAPVKVKNERHQFMATLGFRL